MKNNDPTKTSKFISYLDMNNLYDNWMSQYLPDDGFKWLKNVDNIDANSISENNSIGCIVKVDQEHPDELHKRHNDYPLAPEKLTIPYDMLSFIVKKLLASME